MELYFYAPREKVELLSGSRQKAFLAGGDFGYGNFGDVLQHAGAISVVRDNSSLAVIAVQSIATISKFGDIRKTQKSYGVDCLLFVSDAPLDEDCEKKFGLEPVTSILNVAYVQLYGGGFLNGLWGDYVLNVIEAVLSRAGKAAYVISGQQVSEDFIDRVVAHVSKFKPLLFGVRDQRSEQLLSSAGIEVEFSFDDAVEPLLKLRELLRVKAGSGLLVHLNTSDYTGNDTALQEIRADLTVMSRVFGEGAPLTLLQAYRDSREEVVDSIESVKRLDSGFSFPDIRLIQLMNVLDHPGSSSSLMPLIGDFAYSCSYHVTLWMQLCGIPCWLRGENAYYRQKREALGVTFDSFSDFLAGRKVPDHAQKLNLRSSWLGNVTRILRELDIVSDLIEFSLPSSDCVLLNFRYKGDPSLSERLSFAWGQKLHIDGLLEKEREKANYSAARIAELNCDNEELRERGRAMIGRITVLGQELHKVSSDNNWLRVELDRLSQDNVRLQSEINQCLDAQEVARFQLDRVYQSTSWQWTRPMRVLVRYCRTARFDAAGEIGLFEALRRSAYKFRVSPKVRTVVGSVLNKFRR
ncbi:polysaccharide pyruvyl transferase family protein [Microbulbifer harenosus]|uniref:Polysaccharide pyruvyl transferase domain-containing protein n=1 Tax=Microbulbifer harenosus TaxID=2576840 RepID=A0ABY2UK55_9GAMM|nr:hypothetical protein [Microbulbifer harenosus]TLM78654.1 hypothetical protein FDY93_05185 [Microbulbifer harenosus]